MSECLFCWEKGEKKATVCDDSLVLCNASFWSHFVYTTDRLLVFNYDFIVPQDNIPNVCYVANLWKEESHSRVYL